MLNKSEVSRLYMKQEKWPKILWDFFRPCPIGCGQPGHP